MPMATLVADTNTSPTIFHHAGITRSGTTWSPYCYLLSYD